MVIKKRVEKDGTARNVHYTIFRFHVVGVYRLTFLRRLEPRVLLAGSLVERSLEDVGPVELSVERELKQVGVSLEDQLSLLRVERLLFRLRHFRRQSHLPEGSDIKMSERNGRTCQVGTVRERKQFLAEKTERKRIPLAVTAQRTL